MERAKLRVWHDDELMNPSSRTSDMSSAGKQIATWLTVLQVVNVLSALVSLLAIVMAGSTPTGSGLSRDAERLLALVQLLYSAAFVLVLQLMKRWISSVRAWTTDEAAPPPPLFERNARSLDRWLAVGQWLPLVIAVLLVPLVWSGVNLGLDPTALREQLGEQGRDLTPEQISAAMRLGLGLGLTFFVVPVVVIQWAVLGWVRRWMRGVSDAVLDRPSRERRLPEVSATLARWFTFFQVLQVFVVVLILLVPLLSFEGGQAPDRLMLLVAFLTLALQIALLQWTKTFMAGILARLQGSRPSAIP